MKKTVFVSTTSFAEFDDSYVREAERLGYEVRMNTLGRKLVSGELMSLAKGAVGIIAGTEDITRDVLSGLPGLKVVSRCGAGMDNIDLKAASELGIKVFNTPDAPTLAVAELTVGMMLSLLRRVAEMDRVVRQGGWKKHTGTLLKGKKAGIIGFGRIGQKVADILRAFSAEIGYYDAKGDGKVGDHRFMPFEELLRWGDIFSVHIAARSGDLPVIGDNEIKQMKEGVYILNLSRGGAVSEQALEKYLKNGKVAGAGLDVFAKEPYTGELARFENVILTPHIGSYAKESRVEMEKRSMENLLGALEGTR